MQCKTQRPQAERFNSNHSGKYLVACIGKLCKCGAINTKTPFFLNAADVILHLPSKYRLADNQIRVHKPFKTANIENPELYTSLWGGTLWHNCDIAPSSGRPSETSSRLERLSTWQPYLDFRAQPEMTCNQAILLATVCPGYVLF